MCYHNINMDAYKRKDHFQYFKNLAYPYVGVSVNVEITELYAVVKAQKLPFFLTFLYCVARAANQVPEFRQRISGDGIVEYDYCKTSHTVALDDGTYCYCTLNCDLPFRAYLPDAVRSQEEAKREKSVQDQDDGNELIFISTLPWLSYTSLVQPVPMPADSNPRITWGAFFEQDTKRLLPVSVLCNHALVDGAHISQFYSALRQQIRELTGVINLPQMGES